MIPCTHLTFIEALITLGLMLLIAVIFKAVFKSE